MADMLHQDPELGGEKDALLRRANILYKKEHLLDFLSLF